MSAAVAPQERKYLTVEEYLEGEKRSEVRHEYFAREGWAMAGASDEHEPVAGNFFALLHAPLTGKPCRVFKAGLNLRLRMMGRDLFYYPDVMVACDPAVTHRYFRKRPKLLIEVLSDDENKDLVEQYFASQRIPSLEEYVVVWPNSDRREVRVFRREEGGEPGETHHDDVFTLPSVGLTMSVSALDEV
jgi:Uma2 family endonuclease